MHKITIQIKSDENANEIFELMKSLGVMDASLNDRTVTGIAPNNLIGPLRNTRGVESLTDGVQSTQASSAPEPELAPAPTEEKKPVLSSFKSSFFNQKT